MARKDRDHNPSPTDYDRWVRIPHGPRGFPIKAGRGCEGNIVVERRSVYCRTCGKPVRWRQVAHTETDDRNYLKEKMLLEVDYERSTRARKPRSQPQPDYWNF